MSLTSVLSALFAFAGITVMLLYYYGLYPLLYYCGLQKLYRTSVLIFASSLALCLPICWGEHPAKVMMAFYLLAFVLSALVVLLGAMGKKKSIDIFLLAHIPPLLCGIGYMIYNAGSTKNEIYNLLNLSFKVLVKDPNLAAQDLERTAEIFNQLIPALWIVDLSFRLFVGLAVLSYLERRTNKIIETANIYLLKYPDWPIWIVISSLSILLLSISSDIDPRFGDPIFWLTISILLVLSPFYFIRGYAVLTRQFYFNKTVFPSYLKFAMILLVFWLLPYFIIMAMFTGIMDTWLDFKKKYNTKAE